MLLERGVHRYDRSKYPKSRLPGIAVCMFEAEVFKADKLEAMRKDSSTARVSFDAETVREET